MNIIQILLILFYFFLFLFSFVVHELYFETDRHFYWYIIIFIYLYATNTNGPSYWLLTYRYFWLSPPYCTYSTNFIIELKKNLWLFNFTILSIYKHINIQCYMIELSTCHQRIFYDRAMYNSANKKSAISLCSAHSYSVRLCFCARMDNAWFKTS
jgi:hypothetical protein